MNEDFQNRLKKDGMVLITQEEWDKTRKIAAVKKQQTEEEVIVKKVEKCGLHLHRWRTLQKKEVVVEFPTGEQRRLHWLHYQQCYKCGKKREKRSDWEYSTGLF